jgi:hypothetical protein
MIKPREAENRLRGAAGDLNIDRRLPSAPLGSTATISGSSSHATKARRRNACRNWQTYWERFGSTAPWYSDQTNWGQFFDEDQDTQRPEGDKETAPPLTPPEKEDSHEVDIEADISAELDSLRPPAPSNGVGVAKLQKLSLVTLDIPCVCFARFPAQTNVDPVEVVRKLCLSASSKDASGPRSRYIKRLTPVSLVRKTLNDGLESLCNQVLPKYFLVDSENEHDKANPGSDDTSPQTPCKFAIRPTIRNNNKLNRDEVIKIIADRIQALGKDKHKVDLKGYDKLVLVDVYRNVVGMSVVGSEFEKLKRFNLAELHATHLEEDLAEEAHQKGGT